MPLTLNGTTGIAGVDGSAGTPALKGGTSSTAGIAYPAADTVSIATASTERVRVDSSGNLLVGVTSANANGGVLQLKSGITFPATQVSASDVNTLDDYEEGTWTPTLAGNSTAGSCTYGSRQGTYVKIGKYVFAQMYVACQSTHSGTGVLLVTGLPFTFTGSYGGGSTVVYKGGWSTNGPDFAQLEANTTTAFIRYDTNTGQADITPSNVQNGSEVMFMFCYIANA